MDSIILKAMVLEIIIIIHGINLILLSAFFIQLKMFFYQI